MRISACVFATVMWLGLGCKDDAGELDAAPIDARITIDARAGACGPAATCPGPRCAIGCCALGERCVDGVCQCGDTPACSNGDTCEAAGPIGVDQCGTICCGQTQACPQ